MVVLPIDRISVLFLRQLIAFRFSCHVCSMFSYCLLVVAVVVVVVAAVVVLVARTIAFSMLSLEFVVCF